MTRCTAGLLCLTLLGCACTPDAAVVAGDLRPEAGWYLRTVIGLGEGCDPSWNDLSLVDAESPGSTSLDGAVAVTENGLQALQEAAVVVSAGRVRNGLYGEAWRCPPGSDVETHDGCTSVPQIHPHHEVTAEDGGVFVVTTSRAPDDGRPQDECRSIEVLNEWLGPVEELDFATRYRGMTCEGDGIVVTWMDIQGEHALWATTSGPGRPDATWPLGLPVPDGAQSFRVRVPKMSRDASVDFRLVGQPCGAQGTHEATLVDDRIDGPVVLCCRSESAAN